MVAELLSTAPAAAAGTCLLDWLVARFGYFDADGWARAIAGGQVRRNGELADGTERLLAGDRIAFRPPPVAAAGPGPLRILHHDADLVAVDKPPHLVVQRETAFPASSLCLALAAQLGVDAATLEPVHRLDRETSGVMVFARHAAAARGCQRQFEAGAVRKSYLAIVHGIVPWQQHTLDAPIGPAPGSAVAARRAVVPAGSRGARSARTTFTRLRTLAGASLLRAEPHTGRTHQIRVHLEHLGHALLGDKLYGQPDAHWLAHTAERKRDGAPAWPSTRQLLHAERLQLAHPLSGAPLDLVAAMPADLRALLPEGAADGSALRHDLD